MELIAQEVTAERYVDIPGEVLDVYRLWRPLAAVPGAPAGEGAGDAGPDLLQVRGRLARRVAQAEHRRPAGLLQRAGRGAAADHRDRRRASGARALAFACAQFGLECEVWQVARLLRPEAATGGSLMEIYGATVHREPVRRSPRPAARSWPRTRTTPASLGIAISEAVEVAAQDPEARYALGSVLNHVLLHQTVIGEEALAAVRRGRRGARRHRRAAPAAVRTSAGWRSRSSARSWPGGWLR